MLRVSYGKDQMGHAYCIYQWHGKTYAYDTLNGSREITPGNLSADAVRLVVDRDNLSGEYVR